MADHVFPEDSGTGAAEGDYDDAANFASLAQAIGLTDYVVQGLNFTLNAGTPSLDISKGKAVVTQSQATSSQSAETRDGVAFVAEMDARTGLSLTDGDVNHVFLSVDLSSDDTINVVINTTDSAPAEPYVKLGTVDTSADTTTELNKGTPIEADTLRGNNGTAGQVLKTDGSSTSWASVSAGGKFEDALANGKVLADDGNLYNSIQTAENNSSTYIFIGKGVFNESVTIDTTGLTVIGAGRETVVDGDKAIGISVSSGTTDVTIKNLNARTTGGGGNFAPAIRLEGADSKVENVKVTDSDRSGIRIDATNCTISNSIVEGIESGEPAVFVYGEESIIENCKFDSDIEVGKVRCKILGNNVTSGTILAHENSIVKNNTVTSNGAEGIQINQGETIVEGNVVNNPTGTGIKAASQSFGSQVCNNHVQGSSGTGIDVFSDDIVVQGNRVVDSGDDGISITGADCIVVANRVSGSTNTSIDDTGTGTVVNNNITGDPN